MTENLTRSQLPNVQEELTPHLSPSTFDVQVKPLDWSNRTSFSKSGIDSASFDTNLSATFRKWLTVFICSGRALDRTGLPLYVEVTFRDSVSTVDDQQQFWRSLLAEASFTRVVHALPPRTPTPSVYIPAEFGHPCGGILASMTRSERIKGLFVACYGYHNVRVCSGCVNSFASNITTLNEHVMTPFFGCISMDQYQGGSCANCVYHGKGSTCEWFLYPAYRLARRGEVRTAQLLAGHEYDQVGDSPLIEPVLNQLSAPRVSEWVPDPSGPVSPTMIQAAKTSAAQCFPGSGPHIV